MVGRESRHTLSLTHTLSMCLSRTLTHTNSPGFTSTPATSDTLRQWRARSPGLRSAMISGTCFLNSPTCATSTRATAAAGGDSVRLLDSLVLAWCQRSTFSSISSRFRVSKSAAIHVSCDYGGEGDI